MASSVKWQWFWGGYGAFAATSHGIVEVVNFPPLQAAPSEDTHELPFSSWALFS